MQFLVVPIILVVAIPAVCRSSWILTHYPSLCSSRTTKSRIMGGSIRRSSNPITSSERKLHLLLISLFLFSNITYHKALQGVLAPEHLAPRLPYLGVWLFLSSTVASAQFWLASLHPKGSNHTALGSLAAQVVAFTLHYQADHGTDLMHHGAYNALIFGVMTVPLNVLIGGLILWYQLATSASRPTRFYQQLFACTIFVVITLTVRAIHSKQ